MFDNYSSSNFHFNITWLDWYKQANENYKEYYCDAYYITAI